MSDIIVYGRGKTGQSLIKMLQKLDIDATIYDDAIGFKSDAKFTKDSIVLLSPGVPPCAKGLQIAKVAGCQIKGELEFCFPYCNGKCISVTGTNGKTTTCEMIYHILCRCGLPSRLLGNGGIPFSSQVLDIDKDETVVLESSSFQLSGCNNFAPYVSIFTNIAPDHLNYHADFDEYVQCKLNNFIYQKNGFAIFNADDKLVVELSNKSKSHTLYYSLVDCRANCFISDNKVVLVDGGYHATADAKQLLQFAKHNVSNALAAILACYCVGIEPSRSTKALSDFKLSAHRLQFVAFFNGVTFVDDSKATNVHATVSALNCFEEDMALILGGSDKGEYFDDIFTDRKTNLKHVVSVGETAFKIRNCAQKYGVFVEILGNLKEAVHYCYAKMKQKGGVVLMSNACASFDSFSGYDERGDYFQKVVKEITGGK